MATITDLEIIEAAKLKLRPIKYEPESVGYYVLEDGIDMGNEDYCRKCIPASVKYAKKLNKDQAKKIEEKYQEIFTTGFYKGQDILSNYTNEQIELSKKIELEKWPLSAKFSFMGHDPDFGGGRQEPLTCEGCGNLFHTNFETSEEYAKILLEDYGKGKYINQKLKWKLDIAFGNWEYSEEEAKPILLQIAKSIIKLKTTTVG